MKGYVKLELILEIEADEYMEAEYHVEDVIAELRAGNGIPKYARIEETGMDALSFKEGTEDGNPY